MARSGALSDDSIVDYLSREARPASIREIASALDLRPAARRGLAKAMSRLKRRGIIEELHGGRYRIPGAKLRTGHAHNPRNSIARLLAPENEPSPKDRNLVVGRFVAHRDGYGFVVPESPRADLDGDLFIPPDRAGEAMHADRVV